MRIGQLDIHSIDFRSRLKGRQSLKKKRKGINDLSAIEKSYNELLDDSLRTLEGLTFKGEHGLRLVETTKLIAATGENAVIVAGKLTGNSVDIRHGDGSSRSTTLA